MNTYAKKLIHFTMAVVAMGLLASTGSMAGSTSAMPSFTSMDTDQNGTVSPQEYDVMIAGFDQYKDPGRLSFESMDTDRDGMMNRSEYNAMIAGFDQYKTR